MRRSFSNNYIRRQEVTRAPSSAVCKGSNSPSRDPEAFRGSQNGFWEMVAAVRETSTARKKRGTFHVAIAIERFIEF